MTVTKPLNTNFDIHQLFAQYRGENNALYAQNVNSKLARALKIIGFDKNYTKGSGAYLWDEDGTRYLDMLSGYGVFNLGRNHPVVRQALIDFMQADYSSLVQMETPLLCALLARELKTRIDYDLDYVYFCSTGAEANEAAIKFARRATGKNTVIYAQSAFHGLTTGV
ncbi:MAG TPA: aminotransferase class III-fold pyridoxal phosphate-dependent enzyme, partial [Desulfobulbus sp.]|nr:aminotransferase class III-fold pyridoxal phosphate-dependent enzyme [Desulfobulbus sp.]